MHSSASQHKGDCSSVVTVIATLQQGMWADPQGAGTKQHDRRSRAKSTDHWYVVKVAQVQRADRLADWSGQYSLAAPNTNSLLRRALLYEIQDTGHGQWLWLFSGQYMGLSMTISMNGNNGNREGWTGRGKRN